MHTLAIGNVLTRRAAFYPLLVNDGANGETQSHNHRGNKQPRLQARLECRLASGVLRFTIRVCVGLPYYAALTRRVFCNGRRLHGCSECVHECWQA